MIGIYIIGFVPSKKVYVGQTSGFLQRKATHLATLRGGSHVNVHLQNAYNKYGEESMTWEFIDCEKDHLTEMEQYFVDFYGKNSLYNIRLKVNDCTPSSEESRRKSRQARLGRKMPESHRRGGLLRRGENNGSKRPEVRRILSDQKRFFSRDQCLEVYLKYQEGNVTQNELAEMYGCNRQSIRSAFRFVKAHILN